MSNLFCALGDNCSVFDPNLELPGVTYTSPLCDGCRDRARSVLNLLRYDYIDLSQLIPKSDQRNDEAAIFRPKPESSPPISMPIFNLRAELAYVVLLTEREVRRFVSDEPAYRLEPSREGYTLDRALAYLQRAVENLAQMPATSAYWDPDEPDRLTMDGPQVILHLGAIHRRSRRACGLDARKITVPGDCPNCLATSLRRMEDDPDKVWCVNCRASFTGSEYKAAMRLDLSADAP